MEGHCVTTVTAPPFLDFPTGSPYTFPAFQAQRALDQRPAPLEGGWIGRSSALPGSVGPRLLPAPPQHSACYLRDNPGGDRRTGGHGMPSGTIARLLIDK